ncbi:MAG: SPOR domain-containing protein, partial [Acidobacteriota bacterium]
MMTRSRDDDGYLEFQLDGRQMLIVLAGVVILCGISFYIGKQMGRSEVTGEEGSFAARAVSADSRLSEEDPAEGLNFFDAVQQDTAPADSFSGGRDRQPSGQPASPPDAGSRRGFHREQQEPGQALEPDRGKVQDQALTPPAPPQAASSPSVSQRPPTKGAGQGGVQVQVALLRTRAAAEKLVSRLRGKGYS